MTIEEMLEFVQTKLEAEGMPCSIPLGTLEQVKELIEGIVNYDYQKTARVFMDLPPPVQWGLVDQFDEWLIHLRRLAEMLSALVTPRDFDLMPHKSRRKSRRRISTIGQKRKKTVKAVSSK